SLNVHLMSEIFIRKHSKMDTRFRLLGSVHILTPPCALKAANESDEIATRKVNEHYFYFGNRVESSFDLNVRCIYFKRIKRRPGCGGIFRRNNPSNNDSRTYLKMVNPPRYGLFKSTDEYINECYFADIYEDFLLCYSLWNLWFRARPRKRFTLASLFEDYLKVESNFPYETDLQEVDSHSSQVLGLWSIAYASHVNRFGNACGFKVLCEFIRNIQYFEDKGEYPVKKGFTASQFPESLKSFLDRIRVPYLISGPFDQSGKISKLISDLAPFMKVGICNYSESNVGWDVQFQIEFDGEDVIGGIECKLWKSSIGLPQIYEYYEKACNDQSKFFILVAQKVQVSLEKTFKS
ncbi:MAG: hypothetical protein EBU93_07985, partial [Chlamydiae bacterium]|nr:hypothetical protein [Chlamydiota bacterium]